MKTRLAKGVGDEEASRVYSHLLKFQCHELQPSTETPEFRPYLYATPVEKLGQLVYWANQGLSMPIDGMPQPEGPLEDRLEHACHWAFEKLKAKKLLLAGSDCPYLKKDHILETIKLLDSKDAVFGPATDGGFYLSGISKYTEGMFKGIEYSDSRTLKRLTEKMESHGYSVDLDSLPELSDIDTKEDWDKLDSELKEKLQKFY